MGILETAKNLFSRKAMVVDSKPPSPAAKTSKVDGWQNSLTSLSVLGKDKRLGAELVRSKMERNEASLFYKEDDIAARIVDLPTEEMMREGFEIKVEGDEEKQLQELIFEEFKRLCLYQKTEQDLKWARIYGGAGLIFGHLGQTLDMPIEEGKKTPPIDYVLSMDRYRLLPDSSLSLIIDPKSPYFGLPEFYTIQNDQVVSTEGIQNGQRIHYSRVVRFEGVKLPYDLQQQEQYWGESIFVRLKEPIMNYQTANNSAATIIQDFVMSVFKMEDLKDMLTQGKDDLIYKKLFLASKMGSIANAIALQVNESFEKQTTNVAGVSDLLKAVKERLAAATDIPQTILFGQSPGGLGATGESEQSNWYDYIKKKQESELRPIIERVVTLILQQSTIPAPKLPKFEICFNPLWQMSEKEMVELRKMQAETDQIYITQQVLDPSEVAKSRFGEMGYSIETEIDQETRAALEAPDLPEDEPTEGGESSIPEDAPAAAVENQTTSPQIALNGAQVTSLLEIIAQVATGQIPRESGINLIEVSFAVSNEVAEKMMGEIGRGFKPAAPAPEQQGGFGAP